MARKVLIGDELKKAQEETMKYRNQEIGNAPLGVISEGKHFERTTTMSPRRDIGFKELLKISAKRDLIPDREGIIEKREDGIYKGNSYVDNVTQKGVIEFEGPDGRIELTGGYDQDVTLDDLASITAFRYGEKTENPRNIFMEVNGVKVPVKEGEVTKEGLMDEYAKMQGYQSYEEMKNEKNKPAFETIKDGENKKSPYDGMTDRDWF